MREFHILKSIRKQIDLDESLFQMDGNIVFASFHAVRKFVQKLNEHRSLETGRMEMQFRASDINAIGLIDEIFHYLIQQYQHTSKKDALNALINQLDETFGKKKINQLLISFLETFPPTPVYRGEISPHEYLNASSKNIPHREMIIEEMLIVWLANNNPAYQKYQTLFDDQQISERATYESVMKSVQEFFEDLPGFGPDNQSLVEFLRAPAIAEPQSIIRQLEYIKRQWGYLLGDLLLRILSSLDLLREEEKLSFVGPGAVEIPSFDLSSLEFLGGERYSQDREWMPNVVMIAKNTYVWLHQLSGKYQREIRYLSDIPDDELINLARWGINGLWLIGLWERSQASARIKQLTGNPEAISSAYALYDYQIADDLGGELAYQNLSDRAKRFGIRLASDMVPNHTAIDSRWIHEHPEWFISLDYSPFPAYKFSGPDLSSHSDYSIYIEDHYFDRTDAAVVFKRVDRSTGEEQFIYHGNDGTSYPWNDTAQLNYLKPDVREAVIQNIVQVARRFHIIRFDAAMTLTKRHFHRLWFPEPGSGGDIPSRSDFAMTTPEFNQAMPEEFWREVVERIGKEAPDTLLLAEAFWLMESYFVRTLGMHRVYNSAFMNLLRDELNAKYRLLIKNTLEFDPEILKRFVNFQNNPDEETAIEQFGKGDKYFGICTLMATMPGLPMFGHGQIEGFTEKYGMEYRRSYRDEKVDEDLINRHQREIFPLLHKRYLFAHVQHFLLYDFYNDAGSVNEDVFVYSNRSGTESALVLYNNRFQDSKGWVKMSVGFAQKSGEQKQMIQKTLAEGLQIRQDPRMFTLLRDQITNREYIRKNTDLISQGLHFQLRAYQAYVFLDFHQVVDSDGSLQRIHDHLQGEGVPSIEEANRELNLQPFLHPFRMIFNEETFQNLLHTRLFDHQQNQTHEIRLELGKKVQDLVSGTATLTSYYTDREKIVKTILREVFTLINLFNQSMAIPARLGFMLAAINQEINQFLEEKKANRAILLSWVLLHNLGKLSGSNDYASMTQTWFEEWRLHTNISEFFARFLQQDSNDAFHEAQWVRYLVGEEGLLNNRVTRPLNEIIDNRMQNPLLQQLLAVNAYNETLYFSREKWLEYLDWLLVMETVQAFSGTSFSKAEATEKILQINHEINMLRKFAEKSGYQMEEFLSLLEENSPIGSSKLS